MQVSFYLRLGSAWIGFLALWLLFVYQVTPRELLAAAMAAALSVLSGLVVFRIIPACFAPRFRWMAQIYRLPAMIAGDLWLLFKCLIREMLRRPLPSTFVMAQFSTNLDTCRAAAQRALAILFVSTSPNSIVLEIDTEKSQLFYHQVEPARVPELVNRVEV
jgi:multisubunit Na+/H+ antiporter MnhE subunit